MREGGGEEEGGGRDGAISIVPNLLPTDDPSEETPKSCDLFSSAQYTGG